MMGPTELALQQFTSPVILQLQTHPGSEFLYEGEVCNAG